MRHTTSSRPSISTLLLGAAAAGWLAFASAARGDIFTGPDEGQQSAIKAFDSLIDSAAILNMLAFDPSILTGVRVGAGTISGSPGGDIITVTGPGPDVTTTVRAFAAASGNEIMDFLPYGPSYAGGAFVAGGDITGDGVSEVIVGPDAGSPPNVKAFDSSATTIRSFFAYSAGLTSGVRVGAADVNADGVDDIITGPGPGAGSSPHIKVFDGVSSVEIRSFYAFDAAITIGVFVAGGDVNGDGFDDIIVSLDAGQQPFVRIFRGDTTQMIGQFAAYDVAFTGGVRIAASDLDGDGDAEIITAPGAGHEPLVRAFDGPGGIEIGSFLAYDAAMMSGVFVASSGSIQLPLCPADFDRDHAVGPADLAQLLAAWGACGIGGPCFADIAPPEGGDGVVGAADLAQLLAQWGACE